MKKELVAMIMAGAMASTAVGAPPITRKGDTVDTLHGVRVEDPYRWLEDANSAETKAWVEAQNRHTRAFLDAIPGREALIERFTKLVNYERFGLPSRAGRRVFFTRNEGLQNQSPYYVAEGLNRKPRVLIDPNEMSKDGTVSITPYPSWDGEYVAYSIASGGSDWQKWRIRRVDDGKDLAETLEWSKFSGAAWSRDNKGFFYSKYPEPKAGEALQDVNLNQKLMYHRLGTPQSEDKVVYESPENPNWGFGAEVSEDGKWLVIGIWQGTDRNNRVHVKSLESPDAPVIKLLDGFDASYGFVGNAGRTFYFQTDKDAPRSRVIAVNLGKPAPEHWKTVVPEASETLQSVDLVGGRFLAQYLKDAQGLVRVFGRDGNALGDVPLPGIGTVSGFGGKASDRDTFFVFTSFTEPPSVYRYEVRSNRVSLWRRPNVPFDGTPYQARQVFFTSKDGTRVPMFVVARKDVKLDGNNPTLLYGYGGFNASMTPFYGSFNAKWLELGGVFALANIRGGGEYGAAWHDAGRLKNKQNVFDDFIAAAEWLVANKYTQPSRLAMQGGSNGGLLVGAILNQRPDLFGAAIPEVGVMDMLRFHLFTIGWAWKSDYGDPEVKADFEVLLRYSPLHNVKAGGRYPAVLVTTGDHDDRVVPAHSYKYAAAMQAAQAGEAPILIRVETSAGHGAGKPLSKVIEEMADQMQFLRRSLGMPTE